MKITWAGERMNLLDEDNSLAGYILFPGVKKGLVNVSEIYLYSQYRGKGYEALMMEELFARLRGQDSQMILTCSAAQKYLTDHPEHADLLAKDIHFEKH